MFNKDLTEDVIDAAFDVHNALGCGLLEKVYENALAWELALRNREVKTRQEFKVIYKKKEVGVCYADMVVEDKVVVEVKSVNDLRRHAPRPDTQLPQGFRHKGRPAAELRPTQTQVREVCRLNRPSFSRAFTGSDPFLGIRVHQRSSVVR